MTALFYLPFPTLAAAQARNAAYAAALGCDGVTTKYWWPIVSLVNPDTNGNNTYITVWTSGQYGYPTNLVSGSATDLSPAEKSSLLTTSQVSPSTVTPSGGSFPRGQLATYVLPAGTFTDPRGEVLTYAANLGSGNPLPAWLICDSTTGTMSGIPPAPGSINITVTATDQSGFSSAVTFTLTAT